ncbi:MAG: hypothetical protein AAGA21_01555 [Pseudomonadota bacterium]
MKRPFSIVFVTLFSAPPILADQIQLHGHNGSRMLEDSTMRGELYNGAGVHVSTQDNDGRTPNAAACCGTQQTEPSGSNLRGNDNGDVIGDNDGGDINGNNSGNNNGNNNNGNNNGNNGNNSNGN